MSDQTPITEQNQEQTAGQSPEVSAQDDTHIPGQSIDELPEWAQKLIRDGRKEAAKYRNERNELKPLADKYADLEESKKSELEKAQERIAALEQEANAAKSQAVKAQVASETGVPIELLPDGDEESLRAHAERLVEWGSKSVDASKPKAPHVPTVGREGGDDRDAYARKILGI